MNSEQLEGAKKLFFILLCIDIVATAIVGFNAFSTVGALREVQSGARNIDQSMIGSLEFWDGFSKLLFLTMIGVAFGLVKWLNACYSFAKQTIGAIGFKNEGWTAAGWIIPLFNLFKPYQIINEIYKAGSNGYVAPDGWKKESGSGALLTWWIFWVVTHFIGWIISKQVIRTVFRDDITIPQAIGLTELQAWACMISLIIAGLWFWVANLLTQRMLDRNDIPANGQSVQPDTRTNNPSPISRPIATPTPAATETPAITPSERCEAAIDIPEVAPSRLTIPIPAMPESDDWAFEKVADELETSTTDKVLWTRVFAESGGEENKAKALYIQRRVGVLIEAEKKCLVEEYARGVETQRQQDEHDKLERMRALETRCEEENRRLEAEALAKVELEKIEAAKNARQAEEQARHQQEQQEAKLDRLGKTTALLSPPKLGMSIGTTMIVALSITAVLIVGLVVTVAPDTPSKSTAPAMASTPAVPLEVQPASREQYPKTSPAITQAEQALMESAVQEVMKKYPILHWGSPTENKEAIAQVVSLRDHYIRVEKMSPSDALRRAATEIGDMYATPMTADQFIKNGAISSATKPVPQARQNASNLTWYEEEERRKKCVIKDVMTDEELARCRER